MHDHQLIESAYLSEKWAVESIGEHLDKHPSLALDLQLDDEQRHCKMLLEAMRAEGYEPRHDTRYAMQNVLYRDWAGIDLEAFTRIDPAHFSFAHEVTERRAIWIYRTYIRGGNVDRYKQVCEAIIEDERGHIHEMKATSDRMQELVRMDRTIFRMFIPDAYGSMNLLASDAFWADYYGDGMKDLGL